MRTEAMIIELRRLAEKHKNDKVNTCDTNWSALCSDVADRLEELQECYEAAQITYTDSVITFDKIYTEEDL